MHEWAEYWINAYRRLMGAGWKKRFIKEQKITFGWVNEQAYQSINQSMHEQGIYKCVYI